jgi:hypothetical protein
VATLLLLPGRAVGQSGTVTDGAFASTHAATQSVNLNGQGLTLIVALPFAGSKHIRGQSPSILSSKTELCGMEIQFSGSEFRFVLARATGQSARGKSDEANQTPSIIVAEEWSGLR